MAPSAQFAGGERRGGGASTRSPPASGSGSGGRPPVASPHLRLRLAWLWTCLLLLEACPAATRELTPNLPLAMGEEGGAPARRLQQACQPWPLSFRNENCNGTAAVTVRAQLGAPLPPGSAPCLNGASRPGDWCVRTVELRPGQQQLVFPQVLNSTFQWYAELWGGNRTSPETPWYDVASGQPCEPLPPTATTSFTSCKPFSLVDLAQGNATCVDAQAAQPVILQCNTTCSAYLQIANNCTLDVVGVVYGVLAADAQPGFCVNKSTRRGEWCLPSLGALPAGTITLNAFPWLFHTGVYAYVSVTGGAALWDGNESDPDTVFVDYTTGERCTGPATASCLPFFQVSMDGSACSTAATQTLTFSCPNTTCVTLPHCAASVQYGGECHCTECSDEGFFLAQNVCESLTTIMQRLPACKVVPSATLNVSVGDPSCGKWASGAYVREPCPAACDFGELPVECMNSIAAWMLWSSKGIAASSTTISNFKDEVLRACAAEEPVDVDVLAAVAREAMDPYASCGPDAPAAVATSGCRMADLDAQHVLVTIGTPDCDLECYALLNSITPNCFVDYMLGGVKLYYSYFGQEGPSAASTENIMRSIVNNSMNACGRLAAAAPSSAPQPPPLPDQPGVNTTSSVGSSPPVAAIVGGVVGAIAAVAVCVLLVLALRRQRRRRQQLAGLAGKACDAFGPDGVASSKATSSQALSLASSGSAGIGAAVPPALAADPLVSWIMASQPSSKSRKGSGTSAFRSQGSGSTQVQDWELDWADLKLQRAVGSGSYGKVYLASWRTTPVAVKVLLVPGTAGANLATPGAAQEALALPPSALAELEAEAGLLASLRHPCCVYFFGLTRNPPALVTEYCSRGSVAELLDRARADPAVAAELTWRRRLGMLLNAAEGMVYLHSHKRAPIVHRDFKSPNLLVDDSWRTKVTDFGLSRAMEDTALSSSVAVTNPRWLAPELMRGEHATQASDVFAFGVVMWELLTWERPWAAINPWQISSAVLAGRRLEVPDPAALPGPAADSPEDFAAYVQLMQHCWTQAPGDRPSFPEVVQALRTMQGEEAPMGPANSA